MGPTETSSAVLGNPTGGELSSENMTICWGFATMKPCDLLSWSWSFGEFQVCQVCLFDDLFNHLSQLGKPPLSLVGKSTEVCAFKSKAVSSNFMGPQLTILSLGRGGHRVPCPLMAKALVSAHWASKQQPTTGIKIQWTRPDVPKIASTISPPAKSSTGGGHDCAERTNSRPAKAAASDWDMHRLMMIEERRRVLVNPKHAMLQKNMKKYAYSIELEH